MKRFSQLTIDDVIYVYNSITKEETAYVITNVHDFSFDVRSPHLIHGMIPLYSHEVNEYCITRGVIAASPNSFLANPMKKKVTYYFNIKFREKYLNTKK